LGQTTYTLSCSEWSERRHYVATDVAARCTVFGSRSRFPDGAQFWVSSVCGWVIGSSKCLKTIVVTSASTDSRNVEDKNTITTRNVRSH